MDAVFVIDANIGRNDQTLEAAKRFMYKFVEMFEIGPHANQFGVVQYLDLVRWVGSV